MPYSKYFDNVKEAKRDQNNWYIGLCPFHQDDSPSFSYNPETGGWICFAGCGKGNIYSFIMRKRNVDFKGALKILGKKKIDQEITAKYEYVDENGVFLYRKDRIEPGRKGASKEFAFKNQRSGEPGEWKYGRGGPSVLYRLNELIKPDTIYVVEGEGKADLLHSWGLAATCLDNGASARWSARHIKVVTGKHIIILPDNDEPGHNYAIKLKSLLFDKVASIKIVELPGLQTKWDIVDWARIPGNDKEKLEELVISADTAKREEELIELSSFAEIEREELSNKYVVCDVTVSGETSESYHAVKTFNVTYCQRRDEGTCHNCTTDPIEIPAGAQEFIGSCMSTNAQMIGMLRSFCCPFGQRPTVEVKDQVTVKELFTHQLARPGEELFEKKVYLMSSESVRLGSYKAWGWIKTHPKNQSITFLINKIEHQEEDYISFKVDYKLLKNFAQIPWPSIISDISANVTRIYKRDEILLIILLTFFSPLRFMFNGELIRGWLLTCIIGDSGLGKTQTYTKLAEYTGIGDLFSCLTGSRTGLTYAMVDHPTKGWQVRVGKYPANTGKILAVDEMQHLETKDMMTLSKAMDEGFLQIDKVKSKGYPSKTRLIMLCNAHRDQVMDAYMFGCETLIDILPPTVIRRLDVAVFANASDIKDLSFLNKATTAKPAKITPKMLKNAIYFTWKLTPENISFPDKSVKHCLEQAESLSTKYGKAVNIPLVAPNDFRNTLARISTAFACLDMSINESGTLVIIKKCHVDYAVSLIETIYGAENCQLDEYAEIRRLQNEVADYSMVEKQFKNACKFEKSDKNFTRVIKAFRLSKHIRVKELADSLDCSKETIRRIISFLRKLNLVKMDPRRGYEKHPRFIKFLRRFLIENPNFLNIEEEEFDEMF